MKIKIGVSEYKLSLFSSEKMNESFYGEGEESDSTISGLIHPIYCDIYINEELPLQAKLQGFFHECVHGILSELGHTELYEDEGFVDSLSKQIYGLFKFNDMDKIYAFLEGKKSGRN